MPSGGWRPAMGRAQHFVAAGDIVGLRHTVYRVTEVSDLPLSDADRQVWLDAQMPDLDTWRGRPLRVLLTYVGGAEPAAPLMCVDIPAAQFPTNYWEVYRNGRWPQCSCCGEPMPCRAELEDIEVTAALRDVERFSKRMPGSCWACGELVTRRQKVVAYPGENLDLPGGPEVRFHSRNTCWGSATKYELRWIAVDPRRERILTWPRCAGILMVHKDGSSECRSGSTPSGKEAVSEPDCLGHLTHDHGTEVACYVGDRWFAAHYDDDVSDCPRGCPSAGHPGTSTTPRPERRTSTPLFGVS